MSTRAVYTFVDADGARFHVYKHHDGYPTGAAEAISNATKLAWVLPRFEADEFGAAFIAANKDSAGSLRLTSGPDAHGDLEYRYEIRCKAGRLHVTAFTVGPSEQIFDGTLAKFTAWADAKEKAG